MYQGARSGDKWSNMYLALEKMFSVKVPFQKLKSNAYQLTSIFGAGWIAAFTAMTFKCYYPEKTNPSGQLSSGMPRTPPGGSSKAVLKCGRTGSNKWP